MPEVQRRAAHKAIGAETFDAFHRGHLKAAAYQQFLIDYRYYREFGINRFFKFTIKIYIWNLLGNNSILTFGSCVMMADDELLKSILLYKRLLKHE